MRFFLFSSLVDKARQGQAIKLDMVSHLTLVVKCTMYKASACKKFVLKTPILKDNKLVTDLVPCQLGDFKLEVGRCRQTAVEKI